MQAATVRCKMPARRRRTLRERVVFKSSIMQNLDLTEAESALLKDPLWWRLLSRLDPGVRKDIIGWMGLTRAFDAEVSRTSASETSALRDYVRGAAQALNPMGVSQPMVYQSDRFALAADAIAVASDLTDVVRLASKLAGAAAKGANDERGQRQTAASVD